MSEITVQFGGVPIVVSYGENTTLAAAYAGAASDSADLAQDWAEGTLPGGVGTKSAKEYSEESAALLAAAEDFQFDAPAAVSLLQMEGRAGRGGVDRAALTYRKGLALDFTSGVYVRAGTNAAALDHLSGFSATRASAAYAVDEAGDYVSFAADALRVNPRGVLWEKAATQLCTQPVDFASWNPTGATETVVAGGGPSGICDAYDLKENVTGAGQSVYKGLTIASIGAGIYIVSDHVARGARRYNGIVITKDGGSVNGWVVDFDALGGPTITDAGSGGYSAIDYGLIPLADGVYRRWVMIAVGATTSLSLQQRVFENTTWAGRTVTAATGTIYARASLVQVELGTPNSAGPTSPIVTAGATRAADVATIPLPTGHPGDRFVFEWEGGARTFLRSDLASDGTFDFVNDFGAPWAGSPLKRAFLRPAFDEKLLAAPPGAGPACLTSWEGTHSLNGQAFESEADLAAALGCDGATLSVMSGYVAPDAINLLADVDPVADAAEFDAVQDATRGTSGAYLTMTIGTNGAIPSVVARKVYTDPARAIRFSATCKASVSGGSLAVGIAMRNDFASGTVISVTRAGTADTSLTVVGPAAWGSDTWVGMYHLSGSPVGLIGYMKDLELVYTSPWEDFPSGNVSVEVSDVSASALPSATEVLFQIDCGSSADRWRVERHTDGSVHLTAQIAAGQVSNGAPLTEDITLGSLATSTPYHVFAGASGTKIRGAFNGAGFEVDRMLPVSAAALRFGQDSVGGSRWTGTIGNKRVFPGVPSLQWMIDRTASAIDAYPIKLAIFGDSYGALETGVTSFLAEQMVTVNGRPVRRFEIDKRSVGSTTFADQAAAIIAAAGLCRDCTVLWWDGSENGHTDGQYATELGLYQDVLTALGHSRLLYVRSGQIGPYSSATPGTTLVTSRATSAADMDNLYEAIRGVSGPIKIYDPLPIARRRLTGDPGSALRLAQESDLLYGYFPRDAFVDGAHLDIPTRREIANGVPGLPGLGDAAEAVARA